MDSTSGNGPGEHLGAGETALEWEHIFVGVPPDEGLQGPPGDAPHTVPATAGTVLQSRAEGFLRESQSHSQPTTNAYPTLALV